VCIALIASGAVLILAVEGRLGEGVPSFIPDAPVVVFVALFVWISLASYVSRGPAWLTAVVVNLF